jgi:regulator of nucleoside diphosphate kinase
MLSSKKDNRPPIVVADDQHERLVDLALSTMDRMPGAVVLFAELARAKTVDRLPQDAIGINSVATFEYDGARYRDYVLVEPHQADFSKGRISILTPVGAMLLGLSEGQTMEWIGEDGRTHRVTIEQVQESPAQPTPIHAPTAR